MFQIIGPWAVLPSDKTQVQGTNIVTSAAPLALRDTPKSLSKGVRVRERFNRDSFGNFVLWGPEVNNLS